MICEDPLDKMSSFGNSDNLENISKLCVVSGILHNSVKKIEDMDYTDQNIKTECPIDIEENFLIPKNESTSLKCNSDKNLSETEYSFNEDVKDIKAEVHINGLTELTFASNSTGSLNKFENYLDYHTNKFEDVEYDSNICSSNFTNLSSLNKHSNKTLSNETSYNCSKCPKTFKRPVELHNHIRGHINKESLVCEVCNKYFSTNNYLKEHMQMHTGQKNYVCDVCGKSFTLKSTFVRHQRMHSDKKPYKCKNCRKAFKCKDNLEIHERKHTSGKNIVSDNLIMSYQLIIEEKITMADLKFDNNLKCIEWLVKRHLLHNSCICERCNISMSFGKRKSTSDGYHWRCRICGVNNSIRKNSFFKNSNLSLEKILLIIYGWVNDDLQKDISFEINLGEKATHTTIHWYSCCRDICTQYLIDHPIMIGGLDDNRQAKIVEIDVCKWREGRWVFGGIETKTGKCFLIEIPDRDEEILYPIIERYIVPGTTIKSNGSAVYSNINRIQKGIYNHEQNFKDSQDPSVHNQNIENMWIRAKQKLRKQFGTSEALFPSYLNEFLWRNQFNENIFGNFLICISEQYNI